MCWQALQHNTIQNTSEDHNSDINWWIMMANRLRTLVTMREFPASNNLILPNLPHWTVTSHSIIQTRLLNLLGFWPVHDILLVAANCPTWNSTDRRTMPNDIAIRCSIMRSDIWIMSRFLAITETYVLDIVSFKRLPWIPFDALRLM